jgi:hypothetical protein
VDSSQRRTPFTSHSDGTLFDFNNHTATITQRLGHGRVTSSQDNTAIWRKQTGACPTEVRVTAHCFATKKQHMQHHPTPCTWAESLQARATRQSGRKQEGASLSEVTVTAHCFTTTQSHMLLAQYTNQCLAESGQHGHLEVIGQAHVLQQSQ